MKKHKGIKDQINFEPSANEQDEELYALLFEQLDQEREISIRPNFSVSVLEKLKQKHKREAQKDNLMFALAITGVLFFSFLTLQVITSLGDAQSFINMGMLMPILALITLVVTFQVIDHNLVKKRRIKRHLGI